MEEGFIWPRRENYSVREAGKDGTKTERNGTPREQRFSGLFSTEVTF